TTPEEKECFLKCLANKDDRKKLIDDPVWFKTCILTCLLEKDTVDDLGDTKTSKPEVLQKFIQWGNDESELRAKYRMVIIWGHGDGFSVAWDATPGAKIPGVRPKESLKPEDLHTAFVDQKVDI